MCKTISIQKILILVLALFGSGGVARAGQYTDNLKFASQATVRIFPGMFSASEFTRPCSEVKVIGNVRDKQTGQSVPGAVIGIAARRALAQDNYISANELIGYARSSFQGGFEINRPIRAGRYLLKVVHPQYRTLVLELDIDAGKRDFTVELIRN